MGSCGGGGILGDERSAPWRSHLLWAEEDLPLGGGTGMAMLAAREVPRRLARRDEVWESAEWALVVVAMELPVRGAAVGGRASG